MMGKGSQYTILDRTDDAITKSRKPSPDCPMAKTTTTVIYKDKEDEEKNIELKNVAKTISRELD